MTPESDGTAEPGFQLTWGTRVLATGAAVLTVFLLVGFLLPGRWSAASVAVIPAPPGQVLPWIDGPGGWRAWTAWPDSGLVREGPERGPGARVRWSSLDLGDGTFEIVETSGDSLVRYTVAVEDGALETRGEILLRPDAEGTRLYWRETGDFGWNPLMGYWALVMDGVQEREQQRSLERLAEVVDRR